MIKPDTWIKKQALEKGMIEPFAEGQVSSGAISYGVGSYGYDMRLSDEYRIFSPKHGAFADPKAHSPENFREFRGPVCEIPPNTFVLAKSIEYFRIPREILTIAFGKSTYARCGVLVNVTPFEPEWEGFVTIAISNTAPVPARIYSGEGIAQVIFLEAKDVCGTSYKDKKGRYQASKEITGSRV